MGRIRKILIMVCCALVFAGLAEAKTYVNDGFGFSVWLPDETEIVYDGIADGEKSWSMRAEYKGLNISFIAGHVANPESGANFNDLGMVNQILNREKQFGQVFDMSVMGYYNNPVPQHYYTIVFRNKNNGDFASGNLFATIHGNTYIVTCSGTKKYMPIMKRIFDGFHCDLE